MESEKRGRWAVRSLALAVLLLGAFATASPAREWKVRDVTVDRNSAQAKLLLVVSKTEIRVVRRWNDSVVTTIDPKQVLSIWYDDKLVNGSLGQKWWHEVNRVYEETCDEGEQLNVLALLAIGGVGYLVAEPFSEREHYVNLRYRNGERVEWLTLRTSWFDHFWLMTDLSDATGLKWLNVPLQRTKLFWSFDDHTCEFRAWRGTGDTQVNAGTYDVVLWEDGKGGGVLLVFTRGQPATPVAVAVERVAVEGPASGDEPPEYCRDTDGTQRLLRLTVKRKRLVLPAWQAACRGVSEQSY